jgi:hypothetical protein
LKNYTKIFIFVRKFDIPAYKDFFNLFTFSPDTSYLKMKKPIKKPQIDYKPLPAEVHDETAASLLTDKYKSEVERRLHKVIQAISDNPKQFADEIGTSPTVIYNIINGRNGVSNEILKRAKDRFPQISLDYIVLGKGQMFTAPGLSFEGGGERKGVSQKATATATEESEKVKALEEKVQLQKQLLESKENEIQLLRSLLDRQTPN